MRSPRHFLILLLLLLFTLNLCKSVQHATVIKHFMLHTDLKGGVYKGIFAQVLSVMEEQSIAKAIMEAKRKIGSIKPHIFQSYCSADTRTVNS